jgi:hypothetical protein
MKSSDSKQNDLTVADHQLIAEGLGLSPETIRKVIAKVRKDRHNVFKAAKVVMNHKPKSRAKLLNKIKALRITKAAA